MVSATIYRRKRFGLLLRRSLMSIAFDGEDLDGFW